ncbi:MAG: hypothetical protein ABI705_08730 [Aestuariivirga sp.]
MTANQIFASMLLLALISYNLPAIPRLYRELSFYRSNNWDMSRDSGQRVPLLGIAPGHKNLPLGISKLIVLGGQILFILMPFIAAANGIIERQGF